MADWTDYMVLPASAYPPKSWDFLPNRQPKPSQTSNNDLWVEMTNRYHQSMAQRHRLITSNLLSETAKRYNIWTMQSKVKERYNKQGLIAFEDAADVGDTLATANWFVNKVMDLSKYSLGTIQEEEEDKDEDSPKVKMARTRQAIDNWENYERLKESDEIDASFRGRLREISSTCHDYIWPPLGYHPRPEWDQIAREEWEVNAHVVLVLQQLTWEMSGFLRGRLFDEYCLMRETPRKRKDPTWLEYGKYILSGHRNGDPGIGNRLHRIIDKSGLDSRWVKEHIVGYHDGNEHIGQWQRYVRDRRWEDLAEKFTQDIQQLEIINSTTGTRSNNGRRCKLMKNIENSSRQYFKRLNGAQDYKLSEKALKMEEEYEISSTASSSSTERHIYGDDVWNS